MTEEGGVGVVLGEDVEDARREFGMRAVVEGEGDGFPVGDGADHRGPELAAGHEDGIGEEPAAGENAGGGGSESHGEGGRKLA